MSDLSTRVLISISLVITGVGALDALLGGEWDLLTVFGLSAIVQTAIWLRQRANRIPVTLRPDLAHWIETQGQQTGEPFDDILDRTVAWHRHGLYEHQ